MDTRDYYIILYDYYSNLFSSKQKEYFEYYYFNNLSLSEISENINVSRNAVHKSIKLIEKKLIFYEKCLGLYKKSLQMRELVDKIDDEEIKKELMRLL